MADQPAGSGTSISAAAQAYQLAMSQQSVQNPPNQPATNEAAEAAGDPMKDVIVQQNAAERPISPAPFSTAPATVPSPVPPRTSTPSRNVNGHDVSSRAASQHPDPSPALPAEAPPHGAPTRQYLNSKVTGALLEGMKQLAKEQPKDPLRVLGEFLLERSREVEGS